jgi:endonuclease/exonuclease/phosphatase family metal-dependent hydrolase
MSPQMPFRFKSTLPWPLPPLKRAVRGYLGPRTALVDELPPERRPSALAVHEPVDGLELLDDHLTLLSFNVQRGQRLGVAAASLEHAVASFRPDLVLLQEAPPEIFRRPPLRDVLAGCSLFYAPFHQVEWPNRRYRFRSYGQLVASTRALQHPRVVELPTVNPSVLGPGHLMKRIALYAEVPTADGRTVAVVNVHNEPFARPGDRLAQHRAFLEAVEERGPDVAICCGDFNPSLSQRGEPGQRLLESSGFENAFAGRWRALDTCFARGHLEFQTAKRLALGGSDHRPIVVGVRL